MDRAVKVGETTPVGEAPAVVGARVGVTPAGVDLVVQGVPSATTGALGDLRALVGLPARAVGTTVVTWAGPLGVVPSATVSVADPVWHPRARVAPSPGSRTGSPARSSTVRCTSSCAP
ncbi:hypothetical protein GCM10022415_23260 [Knoellia locipacati]|uniref:Uncharacterized protein n=1 Tax=Knoellia locipacati TaxID=882824 RepID=A0A512T223_9MICO|nr:hypothetical protein KLO01_23220 [Knoellia locipacati]